MSEDRDKVLDALPEETKNEPTYKTSDNTRNHYVELDALRGIAILGVFAGHAFTYWRRRIEEPLNLPILNIDLLKVGPIGGLGVTLFFLLSGYLLTWTEERRASTGTYSLRSYALRRIFRLVPAYYVALLIGFLSFLILPRGNDLALTDLLSHLTFTHGFLPSVSGNTVFDPVFWSLTPEVVFYALLPLLILKIRGFYPRLGLMLVLLAISAAIWAYVSLYTTPHDSLYDYLQWNPATHLWVFVAGVLLRMMVKRMQEEELTFRFQPHLSTLMFVVSAGLLLIIPYTGFRTSVVFAEVLVRILVVIFFAAALLGSPWLLALLRVKGLAFVGMISYSLFLLHISIINPLFVYGTPVIRRYVRSWIAGYGDLGVWVAFGTYFGGVLLVSVAISYLSYRFIESPFLQQKPK